MLGSVATRERLPLWALLSLVAVLGFAVSAFMTHAARNAALDDVVQRARDSAQVLTETVSDKQLAAPIEGASYDKLATKMWRTVSSNGSTARVTVWSSRGRVLFSLNESLVGTTAPEMRSVISEMSATSGTYRLAENTVRAFVSVHRATNGQVVLVEAAEPLAVVEGRIGNFWSALRLAFAFGLAVCLLLLGLGLVSSVSRAITPKGHERADRGDTREEGDGDASEKKAEPVRDQPVTETPARSYAAALEALEALQPDLGSAIHQDEPAQDEVPQDMAEAPQDMAEDPQGKAEAPQDEAAHGDAASQELMRRREEFKARAAKAELRVRKQETELEEAGSTPRSER